MAFIAQPSLVARYEKSEEADTAGGSIGDTALHKGGLGELDLGPIQCGDLQVYQLIDLEKQPSGPCKNL